MHNVRDDMIKVKTIRYKGSYIEMSKSNYDMPAIENEQIAIESVTKRDGTLAPFDSNRIYNAILKAGTTTGEFSEQESWLLTAQVLKVLKYKFAESLPSIEQIQDIVEQVLISANYFATAKAYILYRDQRNRMRADHKVMVDVESSINEYLEKLDCALMKTPTRDTPRPVCFERFRQGYRQLLAQPRLSLQHR